MGKRKHIGKLTWAQCGPNSRSSGGVLRNQGGSPTRTATGWEKKANAVHLVDYFEGADEIWQHLPVEVLYDDAPPAKRPSRTPAAASEATQAATSHVQPSAPAV
ncbi:hypothetical protein PI125_g10181 [Phytophthora idaei]|nr:hypothetical protein PI125_g10181 [Phytophthora idaei]KAG3154636.1 hypothetical protein PI126_g9547 [Phytophthora idaei]